MLITAVEPRRKAMCALYIDGEYVMNLDARTVIENRFDVGREIDDEDLHEIIRLSNERRAKEKALWLISYRDHSKKKNSPTKSNAPVTRNRRKRLLSEWKNSVL